MHYINFGEHSDSPNKALTLWTCSDMELNKTSTSNMKYMNNYIFSLLVYRAENLQNIQTCTSQEVTFFNCNFKKSSHLTVECTLVNSVHCDIIFGVRSGAADETLFTPSRGASSFQQRSSLKLFSLV